MTRVLTSRKRGAMWSRPRCWLSRQWKKYEVTRGSLVVRYVGRQWWGLTAYEHVRGGVVLPLLDGFDTYEVLQDMKKKKLSVQANGPTHLAPMESVLFQNLHSIIAHMATLRYEDGDSRKPGEFRIKPAGAMWVAEALDYDARARLACVQPTVDDAVAALALALEAEDAPWEQCDWMRAPRQGKAKK